MVSIFSDLLPPPFNAVVFALAFVWYIVEIPLVLCGVIKNPLGTLDFSLKSGIAALFRGQETSWMCAYCHFVNRQLTKEEEREDLEQWMERIAL